jgi:hypothetical protein
LKRGISPQDKLEPPPAIRRGFFLGPHGKGERLYWFGLTVVVRSTVVVWVVGVVTTTGAGV